MDGQKPGFLWIGCSDSRVPPSQIIQAEPGELFIHRNIANVIMQDDINMLSVVQYSVDVLGVEDVIVCGHYGCGGVMAALAGGTTGPIDTWLGRIRDVYKAHQDEIDAFEFLKLARETMALLGMDPSFLNRGVNEGFSGGEKKRNEILQMAMLEPKLAILDETDSGLDIDALKSVANGVNALRHPERAIVLVTHYQRLLDYVEPDYVHVLWEGRIILSGDKSLAVKLEENGYDWVRKTTAHE